MKPISPKQREIDDRYGIVRKAGRCGGRPTLGDSRLNVSSVLAFVVAAHGKTDAAKQAYPWLLDGDVEYVIAWALQTPERYR